MRPSSTWPLLAAAAVALGAATTPDATAHQYQVGAYYLGMWSPQASPAQYADVRQTIAAISNYALAPSLGVALFTGLVAMMVQRGFQEMRWVWLKAVLGFAMFEATLAVIQAKANYGYETARKVAEGAETAEALAAALSSEWTSLYAIMALSLAQVILGVSRPPLYRRQVRAQAPQTVE